MKRLTLLLALLILAGCASYNPVKTEQGSIIVAHVADKVVQSGVIKVADSIDKMDNPYLHSVADALRANSGDIISPADVQKIAVDYGDPNQKEKFKTLGANLWTLVKNATVQFGKVAGTELVATGLNEAADKVKEITKGP